jgi:altronate hydrolase
LAGYINHPNVAGATVLSLGCQKSQIETLQTQIQRRNANLRKPLYIFEQQRMGSEQTLLSEAIKHTFVGLIEADQLARQPAELRHLVLGVECGGSDGFSGISANPAIGHCSDLLVALGASVILSEFPELAGCEQDLMNRCVNGELAKRFLQIMQDYDRQARAVGAGFAHNPSPGNIRDGLITDAMKSAGAANKGGTSPVVDVLDYPQPVTRPGLNLLCTPGGDVESTTAMAGAGATVQLFSTGLGTPTGNPISPVLKVSSNSQLAERMSDIIDLDAGGIVTGEATVEEIGARLLELVIDTANGAHHTKAESLGQDDFIPWKRGISF